MDKEMAQFICDQFFKNSYMQSYHIFAQKSDNIILGLYEIWNSLLMFYYKKQNLS